MKKYLFKTIQALLVFSLAFTLTNCGNLDNPLEEISGGGGSGSSVSVTGITLDQTTLSMKVGDADVTLTATVTPDNATDKAVIWSSNKESVATVTNGVVHAVGEGTATITATAGDKSATCTVTVTKPYAADEYNEASWNSTDKKVELTKKTAALDPTPVADASTDVTWSDGWYTVSGDVTITGNVTLSADTHLILCDGAKLTINNRQLNGNGHKLYIYGQEEGTGKLDVTNSGHAIVNNNSSGTIEIHGGEITAEASTSGSYGLSYYGITMYGGKLNATGRRGIGFDSDNFNLYGGEVVAIGNGSSTTSANGIRGNGSGIFTVYGGKVQATGNGGSDGLEYGQAIRANIKSGTSGIKFYFTADVTDWGDGAYKGSAEAAPNDKRYAKAE